MLKKNVEEIDNVLQVAIDAKVKIIDYVKKELEKLGK